MTDRSRFAELAPTVQTEVIAPRIEVTWNPDDTGSIMFHLCRILVINGERTESVVGTSGMLSLQLAEMFPIDYGAGLVDPVSGVKLDGVSGAGLMLLAKNMLDIEYIAAPQDPMDGPTSLQGELALSADEADTQAAALLQGT